MYHPDLTRFVDCFVCTYRNMLSNLFQDCSRTVQQGMHFLVYKLVQLTAITIDDI